ncbi:MAG TPA: DEAD/DEAH box helicase [Chloroflexota bacterium]|nr:DEAD/DEAH box helicase [Chloroflexota bacterium]
MASGELRSKGARIWLRGNDLLVSSVAEDRDQDAALRGELVAVVPGGELVYDQRLGAYRTLPSSFRAVNERLERNAYRIDVGFESAPALPFMPNVRQKPRPYQEQALTRWEEAGHRGVVVLPTGGGKTLVALLAIARLCVTTLGVVPTLDLLEQWRRALLDVLGAPPQHVTTYGGGRKGLGPVTVMTYDSAAIHARELNRFGLLIFDEVHHLPAASYRRAAEGAMAPFRLGLSATPERTDGKEEDLQTLVGPVVYTRTPAELRGHLAAYREERIHVALSADEQERYERARRTYRDFLRRRRIRITSPEDFQRLVIWPSANDPEAREAMLAHRESRRLSFNAAGKTARLLDLLDRHRDDRVIVFSEYNAVVEEISRTLLIPSITHLTPAGERAAVLNGFRQGRFTKLVTGRVLNEGVDVPDANVAVLLSGSATRREYVQRLGRVLRPKTGTAVLYELISNETDELNVTDRRHGRTGQRRRADGEVGANAIQPG